MNGKPLLKDKDKGRKKQKSVSKLKKELDALFSQYIRRKYANQDGFVRCYTCSQQKHWKEMQCGHFASRSYLSTRFLEENCRVQCLGCNFYGKGQIGVFANRLEKEEAGTVARLYKLSQELTKWGTKDYEAKIEEYKLKLNQLT